MSDSRNSVQLIGHLGHDVELTTFESGTKMAHFRMATNEHYTNAKGEPVEETQWHRVVTWGKLAEKVENLSKGTEVMVQGKLVSRSYDDKEGNKRYITEVKANSVVSITQPEKLPF